MLPDGVAWHPERYHGQKQSREYFEGWYFKLVDGAGQRSLAVIPGVFMGDGSGSAHAFVQTLNGQTGETAYHRYHLSSFHTTDSPFSVQVGGNRFSLEGIHLDLPGENGIEGDIGFGPMISWPVRLLSPGAMGPFALAPLMQCYHGVLGFDHDLTGSLTVDGERVYFDGGRGYIEKDWGRSFPEAWIWMQSNHWASHKATSLMASIAVVPWMGLRFRGFVVGLYHKCQVHRFATYTGAQIVHQEVNDQRASLIIRSKPRGWPGAYDQLEIEAHKSDSGLLHGPSPLMMTQHVSETLSGTIYARLTHVHRGHEDLVFEDTGSHAGLEIVGMLDELR